MRQRNPESLPNIRRIDTPRTVRRQTHAWQVHVVRQGSEHTKSFSDGTYSSKRDARTAAIHYRDALLDKLPPSFTQLGIQTSPHSNTGHVGISHTFQKSGKTEKPIPCFSASVRIEKGIVRNTHIFYESGEYEKGLRRAVQWRNHHLNQRRVKVENKRKS